MPTKMAENNYEELMTPKEIQQPVIIVECIKEPRGDFGLEGYQLGDTYMAQYVEIQRAIGTVKYYRVWPVAARRYYETCNVSVFKQHFKEQARPMDTMLDA